MPNSEMENNHANASASSAIEEYGWYHPVVGYWQTLTYPDQEIIDGYPEGTIEYPLKPGQDFEVRDGGWVAVVPAPVEVILASVTKRQLRLTLVREGISLASVEALIAAMPDGLKKEEAQIEWADAPTFERYHPTLLAIASALDLSPAKVDEMWLKAMVA